MGKITLTDDTLTNIKIMAPELDKESQERTLGFIMGIATSVGKDIDIEPKKTA